MAATNDDSSDSSWVSGNADLSTPPRCMMMYRFRSTSAAWILGWGGGTHWYESVEFSGTGSGALLLHGSCEAMMMVWGSRGDRSVRQYKRVWDDG